jgi:fibronectin-binding autotransporter adhesin
MNTNNKSTLMGKPLHFKAFPIRVRSLLAAVLTVYAAVLTPQPAAATTYYFDNDSSNPGFGTAGGAWAAPTPGPIPGWTQDTGGSSTPVSVTTTTSDPINFGNGATGLGAGTITLSGALSCGNITFASGSGAIVLSGGTSLTLPATGTITVDNSSDTIATPLAGAATGLIKAGAGTLTLSGANTVAGAVTVSGGQLALNGGSFNVGGKALNVTSTTGTGQQAVFNLSNGSFTNSATDNIGSGTNTVGVIKISGGNYVKTAGTLGLGDGTGGKVNYSAFLMSSGYASFAGEVQMGRNGPGATTLFSLSGGNVVSANYFTIARDQSVGVLDISAGTLLRPSSAANRFYLGTRTNYLGTGGNGGFAQLTIRGSGTLDIEDANGLWFGNGGSGSIAVTTGMVNVATGGTLISRAGIGWGNSGSGTVGHLNFNGGTLQASGASANYFSNWTACYFYGGGATIDSQGNNIAIVQPFLVPSGNGVTAITGGSGSGYLAPPVVNITGGGGVGATAVAQIDSGGNITGILITNPGVDYTSAPTVTLVGGGGTTSGWTAAIGVNVTTGGLTKLGSGTLTLSGANTYQGSTKLGGGTLAIASANYPSASALTLSNSTAANLDVAGGTATLATPSLTLWTNTTLNLSYGTLGGNPFQPAISDVTINAGTALTASGTNIVINISGSGFTSGQFPLIKYSGSIGGKGFAAFKLGTLPSGVPATSQLVNNTANKSIDLNIPLVNDLTWNGANPNWDINTTVNWKDSLSSPSVYKEYGTTNIYGDEVTFDDSLSNPLQTNINLTTTLRPATVNLSASSTVYVFGGSGKLSGGTFLNVHGGAALTVNTANDYTGGSLLSAGTVLLGNNAALGAGAITLAGSLLSSDSATPRTLTNAVSVTADTTFGTGSSSGALTFTGPVTLGGVSRALTHDNNVTLSGPASNGGITKSGSGTLTVDNAGTALSETIWVNAGKVTLNNGTFTGALNIAPMLDQVGVVEIGNGNVTNTAANNVATAANTVGVIKQTGGSFVETGTMAFGSVNSGVSAAYLMSGGYAYFGGDTRLDNNGAVGLISQSGGTMVSANFFTIARDGGLGVYDLSGGTHFRPATATNQLYLGTRANGGVAQLTLRGSGTLDIEDSSGLWLDHAGDRTLQMAGMVNILSGGTLISRVGVQWGNANVSSVGYVNFNGGTLSASGSASDYWSGWTAGYVYAGGAIIDSQGNSIGIGQGLLAPTGNGVTSITGFSGSGYLFPPVVSITGDGSGATAVAQIDSGGNVTGILVTCPGVNYTTASVSLNGGGGSGSGGTANLGPNATTGGLTKLGTGTLTLSGTNTYGGLTTVSGGTLVLGKAHAAPGNITVADHAILGCWSDTPGGSVRLSNATLGTSTGAGLLAQFTGNTGNPTTPAGYITNLTLNGPTPVSVLCSAVQVGTIPLFQYSTLGGTGSFTTGTLPQGVVGTITNNTSTKTVSLVVSGFTPLVWTGASSSIWDINVSTNWLVSGTPVAYQDGANICLFSDSAVNGNVVITQAVSPGSVILSNSTLAYTVGVSGAGTLSGGASLTKTGAGTVTLSGTNNYTGPTVINAGTLQLGDGSSSGLLAGASAITVGASGTLAYNSSTIYNSILNNIAGTGTINKNGAQMGWVGTNTFSGTINVLGGKLAFSGPESEDGQPNVNISSGAVVSIASSFVGGIATLGNLTGAGAVDVAFGTTTGIRTLQVSQTTDGVFSGPMSDSSSGRVLALVKTGPATLTLSGTNVFTGSTTISNGTLLINGANVSNSIVTVESGAALGGVGAVVGPVSFAAGSSATNIAGTPLTVDTLDMAGNASMNASTTAPLSQGDYPLINYNTLTGSGQFTSLHVGGAGLAGGATASVVFTNNTVALHVLGGTVSPTPITYTFNGTQLVLNWPAGQGWLLQSNILSVANSNAWFNVSGATPPWTITVAPATPSVFFRLKN